MKKKRFKKLLRAEGLSERIINAFCFVVKDSGGRIDYATLYVVIPPVICPQYSKKSWDYWAAVINRTLKRIYRMKERED